MHEKLGSSVVLDPNDMQSVFSCFLHIVSDLVVRIGFGRLVHQQGTVNEKVLESDFLLFCDDTMRHRSLIWKNVDS